MPGYRARVVDDGRARARRHDRAPRGAGPTGCRYLDDPRQTDYVKDGRNYTGDAYLQDSDGYFGLPPR